MKTSIGLPNSDSKLSIVPVFLPIQFLCAVITFSLQSIFFKSSKSLSAKAVILKNHCSKSLISTGVSQRSQTPILSSFSSSPRFDLPAGEAGILFLIFDFCITCSSAKTVLHEGHQLTGAFLFSARPALKSFRKIHCVHL